MEQLNGGQRKMSETISASPSTSKVARLLKDEQFGGGQEGSVGGGIKNPLEIPEIVAIVCGYIDNVGDLKSVRELGRIWMKETFRKWRKSAVFLINDETLPILVKAFEEADLINVDLTEDEEFEVDVLSDPYRLAKLPFKKYRIMTSEVWQYPFRSRHDEDKILIWERCINPNATFLDVGDCLLACDSQYYIDGPLEAFEWILKHSSNLIELAIAPAPDTTRGYGRLHGLDMFQALQLTSLTISKPQRRGFNQIREYHFLDDDGNSLWGMMPNLKALRLAKGTPAHPMMESLAISISELSTPFQLESISALELWQNRKGASYWLSVYLKEYPNLRELQVGATIKSVATEVGWTSQFLKLTQNSLTKLEVLVHFHFAEEHPLNPQFYLHGCTFPNLTHFKVDLNYETICIPGLTFNFNDLKKMSKLREFHFGTKAKIEKAWVTRKLDFLQDIQNAGEEETVDFQLQDLKSFHFHGNLKKEGLQQLGGIAMNLKTLELVFDQENFNAVKDIWHRLKNLKLLACSDVSDEVLSKMKASNPSLNISDKSKDWTPAIPAINN